MTTIEIITLVTGLIGACAWLPELFRMLNFRRSKLSARLIDVQSICDFSLQVTGRDETARIETGLLVILMLDFLYSNAAKPVFSFWRCDIRIALKADHCPVNAIIANKVKFQTPKKVNHELKMVPMKYDFPPQYNIFQNTTILSKESVPEGRWEWNQNIRIIPCLLSRSSELHPVNVQDIKQIEITLYDEAKKKKQVQVFWTDENCPNLQYINSFIKNDDEVS